MSTIATPAPQPLLTGPVGGISTSAVLRQRNNATERAVAFQNDAIANPAECTLYVILTQGVVSIAANYTGQQPAA